MNTLLFLLQNPIIFVVLIVWTLVWKGMALWKSARNGHQVWFIILLIVNTVGILEIIYIFTLGNKKIGSSPK